MTLSFQEWLKLGVKNGYCSDLYCENHDGVHRNDMKEYESYLNRNDGKDFCWAVVHVYAGVNG